MAPTSRQATQHAGLEQQNIEEQSALAQIASDHPWSGPDSTGSSLLEHLKRVPKWSGDDLDELLEEVIYSRSRWTFGIEEEAMAPTIRRAPETPSANTTSANEPSRPIQPSSDRPWYGPDSTGGSLLELIRELPEWAGDDFDEVLEDVIRSRSDARF